MRNITNFYRIFLTAVSVLGSILIQIIVSVILSFGLFGVPPSFGLIIVMLLVAFYVGITVYRNAGRIDAWMEREIHE